jgi:hypothetical protein
MSVDGRGFAKIWQCQLDRRFGQIERRQYGFVAMTASECEYRLWCIEEMDIAPTQRRLRFAPCHERAKALER